MADTTLRPVVVLVNLGTPQAPTTKAVRPFLREFLSDRRVVDMHPLVWQPVLRGIVLTVRPKRSAKLYASVWREDGSPLMVYSTALADALAERLGDEAEVRLGMTYGQPSLGGVLDDLALHHLERPVLVVPMYPQYAGSAGGAVHDAVHRWGLRTHRHLDVRTLRSFATHPAYLDAVASALREHWGRVGRPDVAAGDRVVLSYHGIPVAHHDRGDPYRAECEATTAGLLERLDLSADGVLMTFQSKFGPGDWLTPATIDTMTRLGGEHTPRVDVIAPGFTADCLETVDELDHLNRHAFVDAGGGDFHYVAWGNDSPAWVDALATVVREQLR